VRGAIIMRDIMVTACIMMMMMIDAMMGSIRREGGRAARRDCCTTTMAFVKMRYKTAKKKKSDLCILPEKKLLSLDPKNFHIHVSMSDLYIPTSGSPIFLAAK
jgi:hypothetical protein